MWDSDAFVASEIVSRRDCMIAARQVTAWDCCLDILGFGKQLQRSEIFIATDVQIAIKLRRSGIYVASRGFRLVLRHGPLP